MATVRQCNNLGLQLNNLHSHREGQANEHTRQTMEEYRKKDMLCWKAYKGKGYSV